MPRALVNEAFMRLDGPSRDGNDNRGDVELRPVRLRDVRQPLRRLRRVLPLPPPGDCFAVPSCNCGPFFLYACGGLCTF